MCGRYQLTATQETVAEHFQLQRLPRFHPRFNISPAQKILTLVELDDRSQKAVNLFWVFCNGWTRTSIKKRLNYGLWNGKSVCALKDKPHFAGLGRLGAT
jgi:putative SOS response-associated peptidase YedK